MAARINLLKEAELPAPHEKLLRAPRFAEKYGWIKWFIIGVAVVGVLDFGILKLLNTDNNKQLPPPAMQQAMIPHPTTLPTGDPARNWNPYTSALGKFTFKYPDGYTLTENASANSVQLASNNLPDNTDFTLTIYFKPIVGEAILPNLVAQNPVCPKISSAKPTQSVINGERPAQLYVDTSCGTQPTSVIYTINQNMFYIMTIQSKAPFMNVKPYTDQILTTLKFQ